MLVCPNFINFQRLCFRNLVQIFGLLLGAFLPHFCFAYTPDEIRLAIKQAGGAEKFLIMVSTDTAKIAPRMLDRDTELLSAVSQGKTIVYYVRMVNFAKSDIGDITATRRNILEAASPAICTAPISSILIREHLAEYKYIVYSKSREHLFEYVINRNICVQ